MTDEKKQPECAGAYTYHPEDYPPDPHGGRDIPPGFPCAAGCRHGRLGSGMRLERVREFLTHYEHAARGTPAGSDATDALAELQTVEQALCAAGVVAEPSAVAPTPAAMLGEADGCLARAERLVHDAGLLHFAGIIGNARLTLKREAEAREGQAFGVDDATLRLWREAPAPGAEREGRIDGLDERLFEALLTEPLWLDVARGELGQKEVPGKAHNPRVLEYHATTGLKATTDEVPWCSSFVNWCMQRAGLKGTGSAAAASWEKWGQDARPNPGCVVVIHNARARDASLTTSGNHVGFLLEETPTHYRLLGGNQSDAVKVSEFAKAVWTLKACRWPAGGGR